MAYIICKILVVDGKVHNEQIK